MRYSTKEKIKKKINKVLEKIFGPFELWLDKLASKKAKKDKEKVYHLKKIKKIFLKVLDFYLYHSSSEFDGGNEAILLIPDYGYANEHDIYNYNRFAHYIWGQEKLRHKLMHIRCNQTQDYIDMFEWMCSFSNKLTEEEIKNLCKYHIDGKEFFSYAIYRCLENQEVYMITRKIYEEKMING